MQHPDEGLIHTWLDGQLPPDEAAALEAHVAECPQCAAKVAEERGYAAGATRILTALDNVPADVIPISARPTPTRFSRRFLQAAAMFLVVVTGGLLAVRVSRDRIEIPSAAKAVAATDTERVAATAPPPVAVTTAPAPAVALPTATVAKRTPNISVAEKVSRSADASTVTPSPTAQNESFTPKVATGSGAAAQVLAAPVVPAPAPPVEVRRGRDSAVVSNAAKRNQLQLQAVVTTGVGSADAPRLSVVRSESIDGGRRIFLRTPSGKIAQLTETTSPPTEAVIRASTWALRGTIGARGTASSTSAVLRSQPAPMRATTWKDEKTGKFYSLMGEFTEQELVQMKEEIEANAALRK